MNDLLGCMEGRHAAMHAAYETSPKIPFPITIGPERQQY
jgi:hypothetical protein